MDTGTPIALATAEGADDEDLVPLARACGALGLQCVPAVWTDERVDWSRFAVTVVRSTWDYARQRHRFLDWAQMVAAHTVLLNPPDVLAWNTDKRYLNEAADAGLPVVPTTFVGAGDGYALPAGEFVVKPSVSAGSRDTMRYVAGDYDAAHRHIADLAARGLEVMIQPYLAAVDERGERALIYVDGAFSHAATKHALLRPGEAAAGEDDLFAVETMSPAEPTVAEAAVGNATIDWLADRFGALLYARVDVVPDDDGAPHVLEIELAEPSLFHRYAPGSADRLAAAIARRCRDPYGPATPRTGEPPASA